METNLIVLHLQSLHLNIIVSSLDLSYNHTERQAERQAACQAAAAAAPMQVYGDTSLDAPNGSQIHSQAATLYTMHSNEIQSDADACRSVWVYP